VISVDSYDIADDAEDEGAHEEEHTSPLSDVEMVDDPGYAWEVGMPDVGWECDDVDKYTNAEGEGEGEDAQMPIPLESSAADEDVTAINDSDDDAGSDFDSDEVLSGDEDALATGSRYFKLSEAAALGPLATR
jgi:hypothetical protein